MVYIAFFCLFAFPLNAGVCRLPAMALDPMRAYVTKKKKKKFHINNNTLGKCLTFDLNIK